MELISNNVNSMASDKCGQNGLMASSMDSTLCFGKLETYPACRVNTKMACRMGSGRIGTVTVPWSDRYTSRTTKRLTREHRRLGSVVLSCDDVEYVVGPERGEPPQLDSLN